MKVTTVRFGGDLWGLLQGEAALVGVSVSQYIREAALARAAAAAAERGDAPFDLLAAAEGRVAPATPRAELEQAPLARATARERRQDSEALIAESEQALHHSRAIKGSRRGSGRVAGETNTEYVARLWHALRTGAASEVSELVPGAVDWRPLDLREHRAAMRLPKSFHVEGSDVIVHAELELPDGTTAIWSRFCFDAGQLVAAVTFVDRAEAFSAQHPSAEAFPAQNPSAEAFPDRNASGEAFSDQDASTEASSDPHTSAGAFADQNG